MMTKARVVLGGGTGDVGSAVAHRLFGSGHAVVMHDVPLPAAPRRGMAFTDAVFDGECELEGVRGRRVDDLAALTELVAEHQAVPITTLDFAAVIAPTNPDVPVHPRIPNPPHPAPHFQ